MIDEYDSQLDPKIDIFVFVQSGQRETKGYKGPEKGFGTATEGIQLSYH